MSEHTMRTYAETRDADLFDWNEWLHEKEFHERSEYEMDTAELLADSWVTCACGRQCEIIPRGDTGEPADRELWELGIYFSQSIHERERDEAIATLQKIEERSAFLIAEITKTQP